MSTVNRSPSLPTYKFQPLSQRGFAQCWSCGGLDQQSTQIGSAANSERICTVLILGLLWTLSELAADLKLCGDPLWVHCRAPLTFEFTVSCQSIPPWINTVQILSELVVNPIWLGCWSTSLSYLSWLLINHPRINTVQILSELAADPFWVGCWLTLYPQDQHCANPLQVGCRSYLSCLSIDPPRIITLQILSKLAVDPIWVGCQLTPSPHPSPPSPSTDVNLSEFAVDQPPSPPLPPHLHMSTSLSWLSINPLPSPPSPPTHVNLSLSLLSIDPLLLIRDDQQILSKTLHIPTKPHALLHRGHYHRWKSNQD